MLGSCLRLAACKKYSAPKFYRRIVPAVEAPGDEMPDIGVAEIPVDED
jgi:hypothetical protein